jgi:hypothetical protein
MDPYPGSSADIAEEIREEQLQMIEALEVLVRQAEQDE